MQMCCWRLRTRDAALSILADGWTELGVACGRTLPADAGSEEAMSYGREDAVETRPPTSSRVREPEPLRDYVKEIVSLVEPMFNHNPRDTYIPPSYSPELEHLRILWNELPRDRREVYRLRAKGLL